MVKKVIFAIIAVFVAWAVLDYIIHNLILSAEYEKTKELFRSMEEMKMVLMYIVTFLFTTSFVLVYALLVKDKTVGKGVLFGVIFGFGFGISMGYGSYSAMPITYPTALVWFLGTWIEMIVAGLLIGLIVKGEATS